LIKPEFSILNKAAQWAAFLFMAQSYFLKIVLMEHHYFHYFAGNFKTALLVL